MQPSVVRTLAVVLTLAASHAEAQRPRAPVRLSDATPTIDRRQSADSARVWRSVRSAQAAFERRRFDNLPWTWHPGREECQEFIGRFCFWHDDPTDSWRPPPEPAVVVDARERLIDELAAASARLPGDAWLAGQRVRYLVQAGRAEEAAAAMAAECRAGAGWCQALRGYALHHAGRYTDAAAAFDAALAALPAAEREEWEDLRPILRDAELRALRRLDPAARAAAERRMWWLADPMWVEPGNDRRTEHFARLVADRLQDRARTPEGISWGDDMREILLRYGEPIGWQRIRNRPGATERASVITHHAPRSWDFLPLREQLEDPFGIAAEDWVLQDTKPRTTHAPAYLSELVELDHQLAVFRRDGRAEVVAAWELDHDSLPGRMDVEAALIVAKDDTAAALEARGRFAGGWGALRLAAPMEPAVVGIEAVERGKKIGGRARFGVDPRRREAGGVALSDVLLLKEGAGRADDLEGAMFLARGSTRARAGERVGLYWEVYGVPAGADTLTFSVGLARLGSGGLRRVAERLGVLSAIAPGRMRWREETGGGAVLPRSTVVALPSVPPGEYLLEVTVRAGGGPPATATRRVTIER